MFTFICIVIIATGLILLVSGINSSLSDRRYRQSFRRAISELERERRRVR